MLRRALRVSGAFSRPVPSPRWAPLRFTTSEANAPPGEPRRGVLADPQEPPLLVRSSLVAASTALMTPLFPVIGFNQLVFRYATPEMKLALHGGTSMVYFSAMTLVPNAFYYAPILLPFALGNGLVVGSMYLVADLAAGGPQALASRRLGILPLFGPLLGASSAFLVPFSYPYSWQAVYGCYPDPDITANLIYHACFNAYMGPCLAVTGLASGLVIQMVLQPLILGVEGWPWPRLAGAVLAASLFGLVALYSASLRTTVPHLRDADLDDPKLQGYFWAGTVNCLVSEKELCWAPRLDRDGKLCSAQMRAAGDLRDPELSFEEGELSEGLEKVLRSLELLDRAKLPTARCFLSRYEAYFDGLVQRPLSREDCQRLEAQLPARILEDALRLLLTNAAEVEVLEKSLQEVRSVSNSKHLRSAKVQELQRLRCAQFREWLRLSGGSGAGHAAPFRVEELETSLRELQVDAQRLKRSLEAMDWTFQDSTALQLGDRHILRWQKNQQDLLGAAQILAPLALVAAVTAWTQGWLSG